MNIIITNEIKNEFINQQEFNTEDRNFHELLKEFCRKSGVAVEEYAIGQVMEDMTAQQEVFNKIPVDMIVYTTILVGDFCDKLLSHGSYHIKFEIHIEPSYPCPYWRHLISIKNSFHNHLVRELKKCIKDFPGRRTA